MHAFLVIWLIVVILFCIFLQLYIVIICLETRKRWVFLKLEWCARILDVLLVAAFLPKICSYVSLLHVLCFVLYLWDNNLFSVKTQWRLPFLVVPFRDLVWKCYDVFPLLSLLFCYHKQVMMAQVVQEYSCVIVFEFHSFKR